MDAKTIVRRARGRVIFDFERFLKAKVLTQPELYYEDCYGTDARWVLGVKNVLAPTRLATRLRYRQVLPLPLRLTAALPAPSDGVGIDPQAVRRIVEDLRRDGVARLPVRYGDLARRLAEQYRATPEHHSPSNSYRPTLVNPTLDPEMLEYCVNPLLLGALAQYYGVQPFFRDLPAVNVTYPTIGYDQARKLGTLAANWHWDTPNLMSVHLLVSDADETGTRMLLARGSHRANRARIGDSDRWYSDRYVRSRYEVFDCAGEAGTAFIFDNNALHRLEPVPSSFRSTFELYFTPGNNLISLEERRATQETDSLLLDPGVHQELRLPESLSQLQLRAYDGLRGLLHEG